MDLVNLALVQKAVRDAHVDHIGPPGPKGDKGDKGDPLTWDDLTEEQKTSLKGADGKSAYQYAVEGGYTGTETEFVAKLAQEMPTALPNPNALTFTGAVTGSYDGSMAVSVEIPSAVTDDHINSLIDAKLGVIENGSY